MTFKEERIRKITNLYYSRKDIQKAICDFSKNREICPRYFESFGKRPDSFQYPNDVFEMVKKGATSFNCSEELWEDPMKIVTGMPENQANQLRIGWDLVIDIDSKYIDYSKICAEIIINFLKFHGIKNIGIKFSGSKGFHIIIPWKAFPEEVNRVQTKEMFPEWPRIIIRYIIEQTKEQLIEKISDIERPSKYVKNFQASKEVMPDIILVSPRHLFRTPYSLHEKTALASVVLNSENISKFELKDADPLKAEVKNFIPNAGEGEASEFLTQALDWHKENHGKIESSGPRGVSFGGKPKYAEEFKPVNVGEISDKNFPDSIKKILGGLSDGKKRALFVLINFFRSIGMEKKELENRIYEWNKKNNPQLKDGVIKSQIIQSYKNKIVLPPNFDKDYYSGIGIIPTPEEKRYKNPVNYFVKKTFQGRNKFSGE
ncbi:hypothetical protein HYS72_02010 [Candidatus Pacearchaeota archaeon]|nr:hypothetical protein [Candidatus Pacearchaeota archaeon]MBI2057215.1 hypothetical protein [Candidatus Pacearchaeota archaeon]